MAVSCARFTRVIASAPSFTWSTVSFSLPSAPLLKTFTVSAPPLLLASTWPRCLTAATVG